MKIKTWQKIVAVLVLLLLVLRVISKPAIEHPYYAADLNYPLVIAHQGGDGLWPGDTMFAFQNAADMGADVLEMDVHITKDGVLVLMHDKTIDKTTNNSNEIESITLKKLKKLNTNYN